MPMWQHVSSFLIIKPSSLLINQLGWCGCLSASSLSRILPTSLKGDVTFEIAEDDWERGWVPVARVLSLESFRFEDENEYEYEI